MPQQQQPVMTTGATDSHRQDTDAMLAFDPNNDLIFARTSKKLRQRVINFAGRAGLLAKASSSSSVSSSLALADEDTDEKQKSRYPQNRVLRKQGKEKKLNDTSGEYLDVLRLLLTPYVASLRYQAATGANKSRLNADMTFSSSMHQRKFDEQGNVCDHDEEGKGGREVEEEDFFSDDEEFNFHEAPSDSCRQKANFSHLQMPVKCFENCQVVYLCDEQQFIFVCLHELKQVSSLKLRLLQKKADFFAKLAQFCFGRSLEAIKISENKQTILFRSLLDSWLYNSSKKIQFIIETSERLICEPKILHHCKSALELLLADQQHVSTSGVADTTTGVSRQHLNFTQAFLFADTKMVSQANLCRSIATIQKQDTVLIILLMTSALQQQQQQQQQHLSHINKRGNTKLSSRSEISLKQSTSNNLTNAISTDSCYMSNYSSNKQTYEISTATTVTRANNSEDIKPNSHSYSSRQTTTTKQRKFTNQKSTTFHHTKEKTSNLSSLASWLQEATTSGVVIYLKLDNINKGSLISAAVPHVLRLIPLSDKLNIILLAQFGDLSALGAQLALASSLVSQLSTNLSSIKLEQMGKLNASRDFVRRYFHTPLQSLSSSDRRVKSQATTSWTSSVLGKLGFDVGDNSTGDNDSSSSVIPKNTVIPTTKMNTFQSRFTYLSQAERRQVRKLITKLDLLVQSNVTSYIRRIFRQKVTHVNNTNLQTSASLKKQPGGVARGGTGGNELHKREALLSSIGSCIRESLDVLVARASASRLENCKKLAISSNERLKLSAWHLLGDYANYLTVKSRCNAPLGAPLTHDMPALASFVYIDRSTNEAVISSSSASTSTGYINNAVSESRRFQPRAPTVDPSTCNFRPNCTCSCCYSGADDDDDDDDNEDTVRMYLNEEDEEERLTSRGRGFTKALRSDGNSQEQTTDNSQPATSSSQSSQSSNSDYSDDEDRQEYYLRQREKRNSSTLSSAKKKSHKLTMTTRTSSDDDDYFDNTKDKKHQSRLKSDQQKSNQQMLLTAVNNGGR